MNTRVARGLYFALQRLRGEPVAEAMADVRRTEWLSRDELFALQAERQREQLLFAMRHVPWYREHYAPHAPAIQRARTWDDVDAIVRALPILEKTAVSALAAELTADNLDELSTHLDKTSGSSGTPLVFPCDQRAWAYRHALVFRCMEAFGVAMGEPHALFFGMHWNKRSRFEAKLRDRIFNRVRISAYEVGRAHLDDHLAAVRAAHPTHFWGYPSAIYDFCSLIKERGHDLRALRLKAVFLTAEPCRSHQRETIEQVTGARCVDTYGSAEAGQTALECPAGSLHLTTEVSWLSLRDPAAQEGDALVTDLTLRAFPMIRYAIGDEVKLRAGQCSCGRAQPMLQSIEGRSGEPITLPNGRRVNANLPSYIFKALAKLDVIRRYRFVQTGANRLDLYLVVSPRFADEHRALVERETLQAFGDDVPLRIQIVETLPHLANAKHRDYVRVD